MNKFNVETPQDWKNGLYAKIRSREERKAMKFKPVVAAAAVILTFVLSTTAFAFGAMPDFFKSIFQGNDEYLNPLYMPKNIVLDADTDELEIICTGIMGDNNNLAVSFAVKSKGDITFDIDNIYVFETSSFRFESEKPSDNDGYSTTVGLNYSDDKTLIGDVYISGSSGKGFAGKILKIVFENLEFLTIDDNAVFERILDCRFESEIDVDYTDTTKKLTASESETAYDDITLRSVKADISNISLNAEFKAVKGDIKKLEGSYPFETVTVKFKDGTVSEFNLTEKTETQNIFYVNSAAISGETYVISGRFGEAVDAATVVSVKFDNTEMFTE